MYTLQAWGIEMTWILEDKPSKILVKGELLSFVPGDGYPGGYLK